MRRFFKLSGLIKVLFFVAILVILPFLRFAIASLMYGEMQDVKSITEIYTFIPIALFFPIIFGSCIYGFILVLRHKTDQLLSTNGLKYILLFTLGNTCILMFTSIITIALLPIFFFGLLLFGLPQILFGGLALWILLKYNILLVENVLVFE